MRQFIIDHLPLVLANWLSIGIELTDRRGNRGSGLGGGAAPVTTSTKRNVILVMRAG